MIRQIKYNKVTLRHEQRKNNGYNFTDLHKPCYGHLKSQGRLKFETECVVCLEKASCARKTMREAHP